MSLTQTINEGQDRVPVSQNLERVLGTTPSKKERRNFLGRVAGGAAAIALSPLLKGCAFLEAPTQVLYRSVGIDSYKIVRGKEQADREVTFDYQVPETSSKKQNHVEVIVKDLLGFHKIDMYFVGGQEFFLNIPMKGKGIVHYFVNDTMRAYHACEAVPTDIDSTETYQETVTFKNTRRRICVTHPIKMVVEDHTGTREYRSSSWCGGDEFTVHASLKGPATVSFYDRNQLKKRKSFKPHN